MKFNEAGIKNSVLPTIDQSKKSVSTAKDTLLNIIVPSDFSSASMIKNSIPNNLNDINSTLKNTYDWLNLKIADRHKMELKNEQLFSSMTFNTMPNQFLPIDTLTPPKKVAVEKTPEEPEDEGFFKGLLDLAGSAIEGCIDYLSEEIVDPAVDWFKETGSSIASGCKSLLNNTGDWFEDKWSDLKKFWNNGKVNEVEVSSISYLSGLSVDDQAAAQNSMDTFFNRISEYQSIYDKLDEEYTNSKVILDSYNDSLARIEEEYKDASSLKLITKEEAIANLRKEIFDENGTRGIELKRLGITSIEGLERYVREKKAELDRQGATLNALKLAYNLLPYSYVTQNADFASYPVDEAKLRELIGADYDYLSAEQIQIYNYIYNKEGKYKAGDYFTLLADSINQVKGMEAAGKFLQQLEGKNWAEKSLLITGQGIGDGMVSFIEGLLNNISADGSLSKNDYEQMYILQALSNQLIDPALLAELKKNGYTEEQFIKMCEEKVADPNFIKICEANNQDPELIKTIMANGEYKAIYRYIYQFSTSAGNMIIPIGVGIAVSAATQNAELGASLGFCLSHLGVGLMALSSMGNSMNSAVHSGFSGPTSLMYGLANGASDLVTESFGNIPGLNAAAKSTLMGFFQEAGTEAIQQYLSIYYDSVFLGKTISIEDSASQITEAAIMGFLMSAVMGGGQVAISYLGTKVTFSVDELNAFLSDETGCVRLFNESILTKADIDHFTFNNNTYRITPQMRIIMDPILEKYDISYNELTAREASLDQKTLDDINNHLNKITVINGFLSNKGFTQEELSQIYELYDKLVVEGAKIDRGSLYQLAQSPTANISPEARSFAAEIFSRLTKVNPNLPENINTIEKAITEDMKALQVDGSFLAGLEHRLKSEGSLSRKIQKDFNDGIKQNKASTYEEVASEIGDAVRYTLILDPNNYANGVINSLTELEGKGYKVLKFKNFWKNAKGYKGINVTLQSPDGTKMELQFHTEDSFFTKETLTHLLYEIEREETNKANETVINIATDISNMYQARIPIPPNLIDVNTDTTVFLKWDPNYPN